VDNLKRITIPAPLLAHAGIDKRVVLVGMFSRLELWEPQAWKTYVEGMQEVPVPSIADLSRARIRQVS
jgi:MraZ protein